MRRALSIVFQFILFLVTFLLGSLLPGAKMLPMYSISAGTGRIFVLDGLFLMLAFYLLMLLIAAARKRIWAAWPNSTLALAAALILGLLLKFGFKSV